MDLGKQPFKSMEKYLPNRLHTMIKALPATWWQCMLIAGKEPTVFIFLIPNLRMAVHFFHLLVCLLRRDGFSKL